MKMRNTALIVLLIIIAQTSAFAQGGVSEDVGIKARLGEYVPLDDLKFIDEEGNEVVLRDIVDKPTFLAMVYFRCPGICSPLMDSVADVIGSMDDMVLGEDFQVLSISFDSREGPELAKNKKANYLNQIKKENINADGWRFMTGSKENISKLCEAIGFQFEQAGNDFVHAGALTVLAPDGKIVRYLFGIRYLPFDFKMAATEASKGKVGPTINRVLSYCYSYDPEGRTYVLNVLPIAGVVTILFAGIFIGLVIFLGRRKKPAVETGPADSNETSE
jgi:protein SCO1